MRLGLFLLACTLAHGQVVADPAYGALAKAYAALQNKEYNEAIVFFLQGVEAAPERPAIRKDLAYTYLKIGEPELAREQFRQAMRLDPADWHVALEYAFLCYETKEQAQARRMFDRIRQTADPVSRATAEQAFRNIDQPLKEGIERWTQAIRLGADNFSSHFELATLAEQRDELELAAEHYQEAWRLLPDHRSVLVDLGRVWKKLNRPQEAQAALLAASRGDEPRAAEAARELLPARYPYVDDFRRALELDPANLDLRRELAYLLLRMERQAEAEQEFRFLVSSDANDFLSAAQLGFLYLARGDRAGAIPLLERVLRSGDEDLVNRVRAVLRLPQAQRGHPENPARNAAVDAKLMAERSIQAGYLKDALKYLQLAHEADPLDFTVMLRLGWTYNILRDDDQAIRWFGLARKSPDLRISSQAAKAYGNLRPALARFRSTAWFFPLYSSRWRDLFSYAQIKTELWRGPVRPYLTTRFIGDSRGTLEPPHPKGIRLFSPPQYLSESSFVLGFGLATRSWQHLTLWAEAGSAINYLNRHMLPDYRGGVAFARVFGHNLGAESPGWFFDTNADGVFVSRFGNDFLCYSQSRLGYTPDLGGLKAQFYWNANLTLDAKRQYWANFFESGPGVRFRWETLPNSLFFTVNLLRGAYTRNDPRRASFFDVRAGFWYAITH